MPVPLVLSLKPLFLLRRVVSPHEINLSIKPIPYTLINVRFITRYLGSQPSSQSPVPWRVKLGRHMKDNQILIIYFIGEEIRVQRICILFFFLAVLGLHCGMWILSCGSLAYLCHSMWDLRSPTRDQTHISCTRRQILPWTTREVPRICIISSTSFLTSPSYYKTYVPSMWNHWFLSWSVLLEAFAYAISTARNACPYFCFLYRLCNWNFSFRSELRFHLLRQSFPDTLLHLPNLGALLNAAGL